MIYNHFVPFHSNNSLRVGRSCSPTARLVLSPNKDEWFAAEFAGWNSARILESFCKPLNNSR
jgi:hypothetical protein